MVGASREDWLARAARNQLVEIVSKEPDHFAHALWTPTSDPQTYPDDKLPNTGVPLEWERLLSASLILGETYGTCSQAQIIIKGDSARFEERSLDMQGNVTHTCTQNFPEELVALCCLVLCNTSVLHV